MLVPLGMLSTPLAAQAPETPAQSPAPQRIGPAISAGFAATLGAGWQIEGGELGLVRRLGHGPIGAVTAGLRLGSFVDEGAIIGGTRGFVSAATLGLRSGRTTLAEMGDEHNLTQIGFDISIEASGYLTANSPLPQGARWLAVSVLPGVRMGPGDGAQYGLVIGPTVFFGSKTEVRGFLAFRIEAPLARRERHP
jgi:hypothetical protein